MISSHEIGMGVEPSLEAPAKPKAAETPAAPPEVTEWLDTPSFEDQAARHPKSVRATGVVTEVFVLLGPQHEEELKRLNALREQENTHNPKIGIDHIERHFDVNKSTWTVLVEYRRLQYKRMLPTPS